MTLGQIVDQAARKWENPSWWNLLVVLPHDILAMMSEALHDTVQAPEIAQNFGCLPEQLLEKVRNLPG